jgi:hypothetical protein
VTFHDLRGTAVTRLALVGCTEAEIATITGLSLASVRTILDAHYLHRDRALAASAIQKLEREQIFQTGFKPRLKFIDPKAGKMSRNKWLPFLDTYRTMCLAPKPEFQGMLQRVRELGLT